MSMLKRHWSAFANAIRNRPVDTPLLSHQGPVPLSAICGKCKITIHQVTGDRRTCARIGALGLYPGAEGEVIFPDQGKSCVLYIHGGRLCLDRLLADRIMVAVAL